MIAAFRTIYAGPGPAVWSLHRVELAAYLKWSSSQSGPAVKVLQCSVRSVSGRPPLQIG
jgi:hypothetical protein